MSTLQSADAGASTNGSSTGDSSKPGASADDSASFAPYGPATTLGDILQWRAKHQGDTHAFTFLAESGEERLHVTYGELDARVRAIAARLQDEQLAGARVLLLYPSGFDYVAAFLGCLYAGVVAVPAYPPDPARLEKSLPRLRAILDDAGAAAALTTTRFAPTLGLLGAHTPATRARLRGAAPAPIHAITTDELEPRGPKRAFQRPANDALAFIQYTSGSTRTPKGVMVSHGNLLHNATLIQQAFGLSSDMKAVIWLPLYHDMGLIGGIVQPLVHGIHGTIMSPLTFLRWPRRWLNEISRIEGHRVASGGPSFAYELCVRRVSDDDVGTLDLSNWSIAFCGAEPVNPSTLERFSARFRGCGFRRSAFYPCYGLAEATLFVTGGAVDAEPVTRTVGRGALESDRVAAPESDSDGVTFVGCGGAHPEEQIRIVSPRTLTVCDDERIGEIWVSSRSVARGYWNRPAETRESFRAFTADTAEGPFLRTGDLGFMRDGELFVTGRLKDLIIIRGANYYPQDIESTVQNSHDSLRRGYGAAFSVEVDGEEKLVVIHEAQARSSDLDAALAAIREAIASTYDLQVHAIGLIRPRTLPKTSSGKLQR
ncbi:MAG: fatty acyl-AMP ligase, partial [Gammaproteobacteria bacterium]|nr:fatty acyl-AMP ligase [Gammaproteobacteria bacterium]